MPSCWARPFVAEGLRIASPCANRVATNGGLKKSVEAIVADANKSVDKSIDTGSTSEYKWHDTDGRP